jgi:hypothetical protein
LKAADAVIDGVIPQSNKTRALAEFRQLSVMWYF